MRVFLIGYMGSGKTTVGKQLAEALDHAWIDLDAYIATAQERSVAEIINQKGEEAFRMIESEALAEVVAMNNTVISCGGGTPCFNDNLALMQAAGAVVYLRLSPKELAARLANTAEDRPLIAGLRGTALIDHITQHLKKREPYYLQADIIVEDAVNDGALIVSLLSDHSK